MSASCLLQKIATFYFSACFCCCTYYKAKPFNFYCGKLCTWSDRRTKFFFSIFVLFFFFHSGFACFLFYLFLRCGLFICSFIQILIAKVNEFKCVWFSLQARRKQKEITIVLVEADHRCCKSVGERRGHWFNIKSHGLACTCFC